MNEQETSKKTCTKCLETKDADSFRSFYWCVSCFNAVKREWYAKNKEKQVQRTLEHYRKNKPSWNERKKRHREKRKNRVPEWLTKEEIQRMVCIYSVAAMLNKHSDTKWHVDHIVPLCGKKVSGLHVPWNLRIIKAKENMSKGNKYEP